MANAAGSAAAGLTTAAESSTNSVVMAADCVQILANSWPTAAGPTQSPLQPLELGLACVPVIQAGMQVDAG